MTQDHRAALHKSIAAHRKVREAIADAAERLANERAEASEREMALRNAGSPTGKEQKSRG